MMAWMLVLVGYACGFLITARWMYRTAVRGGHEVDTAEKTALAATVAMVYALFWPLVLVFFASLKFIVRRAGRKP